MSNQAKIAEMLTRRLNFLTYLHSTIESSKPVKLTAMRNNFRVTNEFIAVLLQEHIIINIGSRPIPIYQ